MAKTRGYLDHIAVPEALPGEVSHGGATLQIPSSQAAQVGHHLCHVCAPDLEGHLLAGICKPEDRAVEHFCELSLGHCPALSHG